MNHTQGMSKRKLRIFALSASLLSLPSWAQSAYSCVASQDLFPVYTQSIKNLDANTIGVRADRSVLDENTQVASFFGNVEVQFNEQRLFTDNAEVNQLSGNIVAAGATSFTNGYVQVVSEDFQFASAAEQAQLADAKYLINANGARGQADELRLTPQSLDLYGATFTTCPEPVPAWQLKAAEINISEDEAWGEAWHARFEVFGVPLLYLPYINFPTSDARKSGLLFPTISSSSNHGFEFELPYYINIAPNLDATITPRYMARRGLQGLLEFRYLTERHEGQLNLEYLPEDKSIDTNNSRYLWHVEHTANLNQNWRGYVNSTVISDDDYLNDFGSDFAGRADTQLYRHLQLDHVSDAWHSRLRIEDFDVLGDFRSPYRTLPAITTRFSKGDQHLNYEVLADFTHFRNQADSSNYASRVHLQPTLSYSDEQPAYDWIAELGYAFTYYQQESRDLAIADSTTRALPNFRWRGRVNFERQFNYDGESLLQTLQPQIQYLYVPYRDQSNIGVYDTTLMQEDYNGLFRARRFTGLDRIADANQVTIGATTSVFNDRARELLRFSLAQIHYFTDSRTLLLAEQSRAENSASDLAAELSFRISDRWSFNSAIQYDGELNSTRKSQTAVEYRKDAQNLIQVSHRNATNLLAEDIEQVGMQTVWSLNERWQVAGNWYYDLNNGRTNDAIFGVQYTNCCWALRVSAYRRINRNLELFPGAGTIGRPEFDNGVSVQFIIKGLGSDQRGLIDMLEQSLFGYRRPFYLSN